MSTYKVVRGDTLSAIGKKLGISWRNIAQWNHIVFPYTIHPGQVLETTAPVVPLPKPTPVPPVPVPKPTPPPAPTPTPTGSLNSFTTTTEPFRNRLIGTFASDSSGETLWDTQPLTNLENKLAPFKFAIVSGFTDADIGFTDNMKAFAKQGRISLVSYDIQWKFSDIITGKYDAAIKQQALNMKAIVGPVYLRLWAEMNGDWNTWSVIGSTSLVKSYDEWITAWKKIVSIYRDNSANNVRFVWCPNVEDEPVSNKLENYWPGSDFVDVLGFDSYNWGDPWQTHKQIIQPIYDRLVKLDATKPIWIGEFGSKEPTLSDGAPVDSKHSKAQWFTDLLNETGFPRIQALAYFSTLKERAWQIDSSPAAVTAFKTGVNAP